MAEEMRILYVALTRAQDRLILCGTCSAKGIRERWPERAAQSPPSRQLLQAGFASGTRPPGKDKECSAG